MDEFDTYLAAKKPATAPKVDEFDSYLSAKGVVPTAPPASPPAPARAPGPAAEEPSRLDKFLAFAGKGANAVGTLATDALDAATLGLYSKGRNAISGAIAPEATARTVNAEQQFNADHPVVAGTARGLGYFIPGGAPARLAEAVGAGARAGASMLPKAAAAIATSRPVMGAATGALTAGGTTAAEGISEGAPMDDVLREAGKSALVGAGLGAAGGAIASGADKLHGKLRSPRSEIGRTLATLDEAKASGVTKAPEFKALPHGAEGFNKAATQAEEGLAGTNEHILRQARQDYGKSLDSILAEHDDRLHLVTETDKLISDLGNENTVNGEVVDEHLAKALGKVRKMLTIDTGELDAGATRDNVEAIANGDAAVPTVTAPAVQVSDLMKVKRAVSKLADYGSPATPETRPYRLLDKSLGSDLAGVDPRIAELNKQYAATMGQLEESNDILYGSQSPDLVRSTSKQKRARGLLGRVGDTTQAATLAADDIERLKGLDPRYRDILAPVEAKKAVERSRFGLPHVSRRIEHMPFAFAQQNATALGVHVADPLLRSLGGEAQSGGRLAAAREQERRINERRASASQRRD